MTKRKTAAFAFAVLAAVAAFGLSFAGARMGAASGEPTQTENVDAEPLNTCQNIALAGYEEIRLKANKTEQDVYFCNSEQNNCFITVSLLLDGEILYNSEMLAPNTKIDRIDLARVLSPGSYDGAELRYNCYNLYTQRELNGATVAVKLEVEQ